MFETELKFQVPRPQSAALARAVATASAQRVRLAAAYADTEDRRLAAAGVALRLRREGSGRAAAWVQTLKGRGDGLMQRPEHEVLVPGAAMPAFEAARHAGTPVGDRLLALLADGAPLQVLYRTQVTRTLRRVRSGGAVVELAHDRGFIEAGADPQTGQRRVAVDELELELVSGPPAALPALALRWVQRFGLWWDVRTKSERGFRLAEGLHEVPAVHALPSSVVAGQPPSAVLARMVQDTLAQVLPNAAEIAAGSATAAHLHQLRVGLRRLRSVLREAAPWAADEGRAQAALELERAWAGPFGELGAARDADVLAGSLWPGLAAALQAAGLPPWAADPATAVADPGAVVRGLPMQTLLLHTLAMALPAEADTRPGPAPAELLQPLAKRVFRGARDMAAADTESLHRLRKRAKRLRYLLEATAPLLRRKRLALLLARLRPALERLGELNDLHTAEQALRGRGSAEPSVWFAIGHLAARRAALLPQAQRAMDRVRAQPLPWR